MPFFPPSEAKVIIKVLSASGAPVDSIVADVSVSENYSFEGDVSRLPIEDGSRLTDHVTILPIEIELDLIFSDTPFSKFNPTEFLQGAEGLGRKVAKKLIGYQRDVNEIRLVTGFASFSNMVIKKIDIPRSAANGRSVTCRTVFSELQKVQRSTVGGTPITTTVIGDVEHTAFGIVDLGNLT